MAKKPTVQKFIKTKFSFKGFLLNMMAHIILCVLFAVLSVILFIIPTEFTQSLGIIGLVIFLFEFTIGFLKAAIKYIRSFALVTNSGIVLRIDAIFLRLKFQFEEIKEIYETVDGTMAIICFPPKEGVLKGLAGELSFVIENVSNIKEFCEVYETVRAGYMAEYIAAHPDYIEYHPESDPQSVEAVDESKSKDSLNTVDNE